MKKKKKKKKKKEEGGDEEEEQEEEEIATNFCCEPFQPAVQCEKKRQKIAIFCA